MSEFKFAVGDRVITTGDDASYLPSGVVGTITGRRFVTDFSGLNEYLFVPDENPYSNVAGWALTEVDLEAAE